MSSELIIFCIILVVVLILLTILGIFVYSGGLFTPSVETGEPPISDCHIAYKYLRGDYSGNEIGSVFTEVTSIAPDWKCLGIFYDNNLVAPERRRCAIGCIVPSKPTDEDVDSIRNWEGTKKLLSDNDFKDFDLPSVDRAVLSAFPYTTPLSLWLAPTRIYPHMHEYLQMKNLCAYPTVEVYQGSTIHYFTPLSKQDDFLVPEAAEAAKQEQSDDESSGSETESCSDADEDRSTPATDIPPSLDEFGNPLPPPAVHRRRRPRRNDSKPDMADWEQVETVETLETST